RGGRPRVGPPRRGRARVDRGRVDPALTRAVRRPRTGSRAPASRSSARSGGAGPLSCAASSDPRVPPRKTPMAPRTASARPQAAQKKNVSEIRVEGGVVRRSDEEPRAGRAAKSKPRAKKRVFTAEGADRHELYQLSVQSPKEDCAFFA